LVAGRIDDALEKGLNSITAALGRNRDSVVVSTYRRSRGDALARRRRCGTTSRRVNWLGSTIRESYTRTRTMTGDQARGGNLFMGPSERSNRIFYLLPQRARTSEPDPWRRRVRLLFRDFDPGRLVPPRLGAPAGFFSV